ncbi:MAG: RNA polymerase sigma factor [Planctomycetes bacterium]|nr:RNA polymerase sigma factor [Planctomycetota bacterium]
MDIDPETRRMMRVAQGDEDAFAELVRLTRRRVYGLIYRFVGRAREADDLAQEAYLRVWQARGRYRPEARFSTWLYTIVARLCLNARAKVARRAGREPAGEEAVVPPDPVERREEAEAVRAAVLGLPEGQRMAVALRYFGGLSDRETAEALGVSLAAAQALLFRARQGLVGALQASSFSSAGRS